MASAYLTQDVRWRATNRLRGDLVRHRLRLWISFHDAQAPGHMIERIAVLAVLPLVLIFATVNASRRRLEGNRRASREASGAVEDIGFAIPRGSYTVIAGRVGSGKSTLPVQSGEVRWNGARVTDAALFFAPPRCAYTGQVPWLFSQTVRENIVLG
jgi:ABC-type transport system involved in cytochrome bd biosynthesis fused ATPase/permease subunit